MTNRRFNTFNAVPIPTTVRDRMTIMPPPLVAIDGSIIPYPESFVQRYADLRAQKLRYPVYIEEMDLDDGSSAAGYPLKFKLLIRCLSSDADLSVILAAARHLNLISAYHFNRCVADGLAPDLECNYFEVFYTCGMMDTELSDGVPQSVPVFVPYDRRRHIWVGLFEAAGYRPQWGNALNIRRRKL